MAEKKCKYCAMMIPGEAILCPHCRKRQGISVALASIIIIAIFLFIIGMVETSREKKESLKPFLYKCLDLYPKDTEICVKMALRQRYSFDDVESVLNQYVAEHTKPVKHDDSRDTK